MHIQDVYSHDAYNALQPQQCIIEVDTKKFKTPFKSPEDWRDNWIYFLMVDRFDNPVKAPAGADPYLPYQGGTFEGIKQRLNYLSDLGVGAIWLSPVQFNPQWFKNYYGGYGIQDFMRIEPRFCKNPKAALEDPDIADNEFRELVDHIHAKGMYVIGDIVLNHMGDLFNYEGMKDTQVWRDIPYDVYWRDVDGCPKGDWMAVENIQNLPIDAGPSPRNLAENKFFRRQGEGRSLPFGDFSCLKELVTEYQDHETNSYPVRDILIRAYQIFMAKFDIDGYRIDTLQYVHRDFSRIFGNAMREYAQSIGKKNFICFGEVWDDNNEEQIASFIGRNTSTDEGIIGVDTAIDFPMRKRLVNVIKGFDTPKTLADHYETRKKVLKTISSSHGDAGGHYITFLDNHDMNERFHVKEWSEQTTMALACIFCMAGTPCVYYGTEQGLDGHGKSRESVREALWGHTNFDPNSPLYKEIQKLTKLRNNYPVLRYGRQYFRPCSGDGINFGHSTFKGGIIAFSRILNITEAIIVANTHTRQDQNVYILIDSHINEHGKNYRVAYSNLANSRHQEPERVQNSGNPAAIKVHLKPMEIQVLMEDTI
nr:alpha-amylase family glycosyl hydrolase [uncultured Desulfobacter sp.]